ncbi:hypothetical protein HFO62_01180 [Rhizobium leguminosarum]|nr:hypothetical protein [Rhizobium leguminosarum]
MAKPKTTDDAELIKEWPLSTAATLGSSVRATAEKRRRAALKAKLTRSLKTKAKNPSKPDADHDDASRSKPLGWEEFSRDGLLR